MFLQGYSTRICRKGHNLTNFNADIPNPSEVLEAKKNVIARFIHVVVPIRDLYQLPPTSVHIFCDSAGSTIAFNRDASIFLNLRYYEAWRMYHLLTRVIYAHQDKQTMTKSETETHPQPTLHGNRASFEDSRSARSQGVIRYFTLAHEIAHNLVQPHNSEHEFYFSSICQKFLPGLSELILAEKMASKSRLTFDG